MMDISRLWEYIRWQMSWWLHRITGRLADLQSIYQPLQHNEIRLITLAPGKWRDSIECNLQIVSLDDNPTYEALSYVWGDASLRRWIYLKNSSFDVSKSLEVALRRLRHEDSERVMWIDAVCINQSDDAEKSEQVKKMQFIYAGTSHLVVWVGEASGDSDLGMRTLEQIGEELKEVPIWEVDLANVSLVKNLPELIENFDPKPWVALSRLFQRPWFQRVWVIQEICMPDKEMSFVCGRYSVPWEFASQASHAVQRYQWDIQRTWALGQAGYAYNFFENPVNLIRWIWKHQVTAATESQCTLMMNLWSFRSRKCGNPRDKVYAILGICNDVQMGDITIDYSSSVAQVYYETAEYILRKERNLKLFSACQSYGSSAETPSWVPDWSIDARFRPMRSMIIWEAGEEEEDVRRTFKASGGHSAKLNISEDMRAITTQGMVCSTISVLGTDIGNDAEFDDTTESQNRMFTKSYTWWPLAKERTPEVTAHGERRIDAFWRTLITDMGLTRRKATPEKEGNQFRIWMRRINYHSAFEPEDLVVSAGKHRWLEFTTAFQQATTNRRFFITREGQMGLGPRNMEPGDVVCILLGAQVPFVLRAVNNHYVLLGECYCHGIMEGEALRQADGEEAVLRDLVIK